MSIKLTRVSLLPLESPCGHMHHAAVEVSVDESYRAKLENLTEDKKGTLLAYLVMRDIGHALARKYGERPVLVAMEQLEEEEKKERKPSGVLIAILQKKGLM